MIQVLDRNLISGYEEIVPFYNLLKANILRSHMTITTIFLKADSPNNYEGRELSTIESEISSYLFNKVRETDLLFKVETMQWGIILTQNGEKEARAFLNRLFQLIQEEENSIFPNNQITFQGVIFEIKNDDAEFERLLKRKAMALQNMTDDWELDVVTDFKRKTVETIKVSILEENDIFREVLRKLFENLLVENIEIQIQDFTDGYEFLESDWYLSSHTHIVIMNDILPRKNGLEVLHTLRDMVNQKKFIIYMMTKRNSEQDMIYAYESGVDEYLLKPFNTKLLEAQLKRTFERVWS